MDAKVIPFPRQKPEPPESDITYWARQAYRMLYIDSEMLRPERLFICYESDDTLYYLNLGYDAARLEKSVAVAIDHIDDKTKAPE